MQKNKLRWLCVRGIIFIPQYFNISNITKIDNGKKNRFVN